MITKLERLKSLHRQTDTIQNCRLNSKTLGNAFQKRDLGPLRNANSPLYRR